MKNRSDRRFPIMDGPSIPWAMIEPWERRALANHDQSLQRLAERGGLSCLEAMCVLEDRKLPRYVPELDAAAKQKLIAVLAAYERDDIVAAFILDRAEQYEPSSGIYDALHVLAGAVRRGAHRDAHQHGELDDLLRQAAADDGTPSEAGIVKPHTQRTPAEADLIHATLDEVHAVCDGSVLALSRDDMHEEWKHWLVCKSCSDIMAARRRARRLRCGS